jgi:hypothetical protein
MLPQASELETFYEQLDETVSGFYGK